MHTAVRSLRDGECSLAVAGGVAGDRLARSVHQVSSRLRGLAPDGRCKPFCGGRRHRLGEGVGLVLLERLSDARRNGHPVLAVLRGSAVNSDGASNRLTRPQPGPRQQRVITRPSPTRDLADVIGGGAQGTALGDPIDAVLCFATSGDTGRPTTALAGLVEVQYWHTQAAAGVGGVIKTVLAMHHERLRARCTPTSRHHGWS